MCSINERLAGKPGIDVAPLSDGWIQDLLWLIELEAEDLRKRKKPRNMRGSRTRAFSYDVDEDDLD